MRHYHLLLSPSRLRPRRLAGGLAIVLRVAAGFASASAQVPSAADSTHRLVLVPDAVWDGTADAAQRGWVVVVRGSRMEAVGPEARVAEAAGAERIALQGRP